jgi:hypothetical protein
VPISFVKFTDLETGWHQNIKLRQMLVAGNSSKDWLVQQNDSKNHEITNFWILIFLLTQVVTFASLDPKTENFNTAVDFCIANFDDHYYLSPQPTSIKSAYSRMLEKLELHSRHEKHAKLSNAFTKLNRTPRYVSSKSLQNSCLNTKVIKPPLTDLAPSSAKHGKKRRYILRN